MTFAAALIYYHWESMLVSYMSARKIVMPFKNLEEMLLNTDFRLATLPKTTLQDNFKYSKDPIWQGIWKDRLEPHLQEYEDYPYYLKDMIHFIRDDFTTALYDTEDPVFASKEFINCEIVATEGRYYEHPYAWGFQKDSQYLDCFNFFFQEYIEKGYYDAINERYEPQQQQCPDLSGKPVPFYNVITGFLLMVGGMALGKNHSRPVSY